MKKYITAAFTALLVLALAACNNETGGQSSGNDDDTLTIYTTVFPLKSFAEQIGGGTVTVETIYPNGVDVHSYEPTQRDMLDYADGDLFVYTTDTFDPVAEKIKNAVGEHTTFFPAAADISESDLMEMDHDHAHEHDDDHDEHSHDHSSEDPHIWLNPVLALEMAEAVKDELIKMNPEQEALYTENFESLKHDLEEIDAELNEITASTVRDSVYISHESIGYLADRYGFEQVGISGMNNQEPSQQELTGIIEDVEAQGAPYILYEQNITSRVTETIQNQTGAESLEFHNLSVLSDEDPEDATYQSIMKENIEAVDKALNE